MGKASQVGFKAHRLWVKEAALGGLLADLGRQGCVGHHATDARDGPVAYVSFRDDAYGDRLGWSDNRRLTGVVPS